MGTFSKTFGACLSQQGANSSYLPVITSPSSGTITDVGATVAGIVDNGKVPTVWSVEYGLTNAYGSTATGGTITTPTSVSKELTGLTPYTTYHWRLKAVNSKGTTYSADQTFMSLEPAVISDGNTVGWYKYQDLTTITKDGSNFVSRWNDKLGSGHDLIQAVGTNQPLWSASGILFDGIDNYLRTPTFTFSSPEQVYIVFRQKTWTTDDIIFDGFDSGSGRIIQRNTTPKLLIRANSIGNDAAGMTLDTFFVTTFLFNGENSYTKIGENAKVVSNVGTSSMNGFTLGALGGTAANPSNIEVKEIILRKIDDTDENEAIIQNYLKTKYSL